MATTKHRPSTAERRMTIGTAHYPALHGRDPGGDREVPYIRLRGQWLQRAGFTPNGRLRVRVLDGCLVMTCEPEPPPTHRRR
jgi:Toxin SymE, type I toxin-antitoxin system